MNPKIQQVLDKLSFLKSPRLVRLSKFVKRLFLSFGVFVFLFLGGAVAWFEFHPLSTYHTQIRSNVSHVLQAEQFNFKNVKWHLNPVRVSVGFRFEDVLIERSALAERFESPDFVLEVEPLKILLGKIPVRLSSSGGEWTLPAQRPLREKSDDHMSFLDSSKLLKNLRLLLDFKNFKMAMAASTFGMEDTGVMLRAVEVGVSGSFVGFPGYFDGEVSANLDVNHEAAAFSAKGPTQVVYKGHAQIAEGKVVGVNFSKLDVDLKEAIIHWKPKFFKKPAGMELNFSGEGQAVLNENFGWKFVELKQGDLSIDELKLGFTASYTAISQSLQMRCTHAPQKVRRLHLPVEQLLEIPLMGMVDFQGNLKVDPRNPLDAGWKISFNNIKIASAELLEFFAPTSAGALSLSFVSEGTVSQGHLQTPRTELQIDGAEAMLAVAKGKLIKPKGDPFNLLLKASVQNDELTLSNFEFNVNNMNTRGRLKIKDVSKYILQKQKAFLNLTLESNSVNLARWSPYIPLFRRIPLEGLIQFAGAADGPIYADGDTLRDISWRVDRISASKIKGAFDQDSFVQMGYSPDDLSMGGPFTGEFYFQGRGKGSVVHQGTLIAQSDFSRVFIKLKKGVRKTADVPLRLDVGIEQTTNKLAIRRGSLRFHELVLNFEGNILHGSKRNWVDIRLEKNIHLENWRSLFAHLKPDAPLRGEVGLVAKLGFEQKGVFEGEIDWRKLSLDGIAEFKDISTNIFQFKYPLLGGQGKLVISGNSLTVPGFVFRMGPTKAKFSLNGRTLRTKNAAADGKLSMAQGNLGWIFGKDPWDISAVFTTDNFDVSTLAQKAEKKGVQFSNGGSGQDLERLAKTFLESPKAFKSRLKLVYSALETKNTALAKKGARFVLNWDKGVLRADPVVLGAFGGKIWGAFSLDGNPYLARKDPPPSSFTGEFSGVDSAELFEFFEAKEQVPVHARVDGRVQLTFEGLNSEEMWRSAKGRVSGKARDADYAGLVGFQNMLRKFFSDSEARDYLIGKGQVEKCFGPKFSSDFDLSFNQGVVKLGEIDLLYPNASKIRMSGDLDSKFNARFAGDLIAGPDCVKGEARRCLLRGQDFVAFPFSLTGNLAAPTLTSPIESHVPDFVDCMRNKISAQSNAASIDPRIRRKERKSREKLKEIFKGSSQ